MIPLRRHRAEHDQFPLVADFVEPEDVHAIVIRSDFDVPIAGSVPLIHDFCDARRALSLTRALFLAGRHIPRL